MEFVTLVSFLDYEKAFDMVCLWRLIRHYGIPEKITTIIQNSYEGLTCNVVHKGELL